MKLWPDTVTAALWNICAESETEAGAAVELAIEDDSTMSTIACVQLSLRSIRECDDLNGISLLAGEIEDGRRHASIIKELLQLADIVKNEAWKEMVAELLEKASWSSRFIRALATTPGRLRIVRSVRPVPRTNQKKCRERYTVRNTIDQT